MTQTDIKTRFRKRESRKGRIFNEYSEYLSVLYKNYTLTGSSRNIRSAQARQFEKCFQFSVQMCAQRDIR